MFESSTSNDEYWVVTTPWSLANRISVCCVTVFIHPPVCMIGGSKSLLDDTEFRFCCKMQFYAASEKKNERKKKRKRFKTCTSLTFTWWKWIIMYFSPQPQHLNMKATQGTCAYRRTKVGGIQCKMALKKGVIWCGLQKYEVFLVWTPQKGVIQCAKMQFQAKIYKFHTKIAAKLLNFSKCVQSARKLTICM